MTFPSRRTVERTYLTMPSAAALNAAQEPTIAARLVPVMPCSVEQWRALYAAIGAPWQWHDRDLWPDARLEAHLRNPAVSVFTVSIDDPSAPSAAGFLELEGHVDGSVEIVYLGLHTDVLGRGLGGWLVTEAVARAFAQGAQRVWLHTCTLDHPAALPNYLARGFTVERTETYTVSA